MFVRLGCLSTLFCLALSLAACGGSKSHDGGDQNGRPGTPHGGGGGGGGGGSGEKAPPFDPQKPYVIRGEWTFAIGSDADQLTQVPSMLLGTASGNQAISATVAANVQFTLSNQNFSTPVPVDVASYGTLDITKLRDNSLAVCGPAGTARCTTAILRIYTTGKPGAGLWNSVDGYGVPILTTGHVVGLDVAGAYVLASTPVAAATRVVDLTQFTTTATYSIPVAVDFTNAGAGSYASTLVVQYLLQ